MGKKNEMAEYLFHQGTNFESYNYFGVHREDGLLTFRVWAPNATAVAVIGDFNGWYGCNGYYMRRLNDGGIWEISLHDMPDGTRYKYLIHTKDGRRLQKADPYAFAAELPPNTASIVYTAPTDYAWRDAGWMSFRPNAREYNRPINVYELHLGSWKRHEDGTYLTYLELAHELPQYVKQMGYTHVELLPVMEHPFDGSWGYQVTGYYAPTARYGSPHDFCALVDALHEAGIGVILDWVPAHFPKDAHGLYEFDGQPLYEYQGWDRMEHKGWGTRRFDVGRPEIQSFLVSNACFWAQVYHADGIRVDAVASMLYLDYDKMPDEWVPNIYGDNRCLEAMAFFKKLNGHMADRYPAVMMIAEESSAWGGLTSFEGDGLGFTYKWNMGWMNDGLSYLETDPIYRKYHHDKMTFSLMYSFGERYMLPISHDEVVHGKKSLLDRAPGDYYNKFAGTRAFMTYMMTHPGKKLLFMGCEYGPFREWDYSDSLEWFMLDYDKHARLQRFNADLNHIYLANSALWARDTDWSGFDWVEVDNADASVIAYRRMSDEGELLVIINYTPVYYPDYRLGVPFAGRWSELISSDDLAYGGGGVTHPDGIVSEPIPAGRWENSVSLRLAPHGAMIFKLDEKVSKATPVPKAKRASTRQKKNNIYNRKKGSDQSNV